MSIDLLSKFILDHYEVHEAKHACAILHNDFPREWDDVVAMLTSFRLKKSWIMTPGGRKSLVSPAIDSILFDRGWCEKDFSTQLVVDDAVMDSPTHKVDCYKNRVSLEIEWNNKNPYRRAQNNSRPCSIG
jgi:hypothetical protein